MKNLLIWLFLENVVNSVNQMLYHWKAHMFTFPKISHSFQSVTFERRYGTVNGWVTNQMCQNETFLVLTNPAKSTPQQVNKMHSIRLYFKNCFYFIIVGKLGCSALKWYHICDVCLWVSPPTASLVKSKLECAIYVISSFQTFCEEFIITHQ